MVIKIKLTVKITISESSLKVVTKNLPETLVFGYKKEPTENILRTL